MGRPADEGIARSNMLVVKLSDDDNDQLLKLVQESKMNKSELIRKALKILFCKVSQVRKRTNDDFTKKLTKLSDFSPENIIRIGNAFQEKLVRELELELNNMAFQELSKHTKKEADKMEKAAKEKKPEADK